MLDQTTSALLPKQTERVLPEKPSAPANRLNDIATETGALPAPPTASMAALLPIMVSVFAAFLVSGVAIPVLPLHVHDGLGLSPFVVGLVAGSQFVTSLIARPMAGRDADRRGAKHAVVFGLVAAAASGVLYLVSLQFFDQPIMSLTILLLGRALLGVGESFVIRVRKPWGLMLGGPNNTSEVLAWAGSAMWASFALGAPLGAMLYRSYGFSAIALATAVVPLATLVLVARLPQTVPAARPQSGLAEVVAAVWLPGLGLALSSAGFGAMTAFVSLLFAARGWIVWPAFTVFAGDFNRYRALMALKSAQGIAVSFEAQLPLILPCRESGPVYAAFSGRIAMKWTFFVLCAGFLIGLILILFIRDQEITAGVERLAEMRLLHTPVFTPIRI